MKEAIDTAALAALAQSTSTSKRTDTAKAAFASNISPAVKGLSPTFTIQISGSTSSPVAKTGFKATVPLAFGGLFGMNTLEVSGTSTAGMATGGDIDIDLWLDASGSMAIAADEAGRDKLISLFKCAFACHLDDGLETGADTLPVSGGDGYGSARHLVVLVTDGMQYKDDPGPIDTSKCDAIKRRGITLAVVHLRYVDMSGDDKFDKRVKPYFNQLKPALEACASPNMFFSGETPVEIEQAFAGLAGAMRGKLRLME